MTPRLNGILETALYVDSLPRSCAFYQRLFEFRVIFESERLVALAAHDQQVLLLFKQGGSAGLASIPHDGHGQSHLAFAIDRDQLDAWERRLAGQAIDIEERKEWDRGGISLYFRDPDGHLLELATPGVWSIY